jgi:hypothetical protein
MAIAGFSMSSSSWWLWSPLWSYLPGLAVKRARQRSEQNQIVRPSCTVDAGAFEVGTCIRTPGRWHSPRPLPRRVRLRWRTANTAMKAIFKVVQFHWMDRS